MGAWNGPSHRNPDTPQIEFCSLCGAPVGAADMVEGTAEGLRGGRYCPECSDLATNPSFLDLGGVGNAAPHEELPLPHNGSNIFEDAKE